MPPTETPTSVICVIACGKAEGFQTFMCLACSEQDDQIIYKVGLVDILNKIVIFS